MCTVYKDINGEFLKKTGLKKESKERIYLEMHGINSEKEHIHILHKFRWVGNIALKWKELKAVLQDKKSPRIEKGEWEELSLVWWQ